MNTAKKLSSALSLLLCAAMCLALASPAAADVPAAAVKEEVIYGNLTNDGTVKDVYAVSSFDCKEVGEVADYGEFSSVSNLTTTEKLNYSGGKLTVNAPKGKFYYQGNLVSKELPWTVAIAYSLDDVTMPAEELSGKSGALKIGISIKKNPNVTGSFFEDYALQATVTLDSEKCSDIVADGATPANAGTAKMLNYTILPGTEKELFVTANVTDFSMGGIQISGIPLNMDIEKPDTSEFTEQFTELKDGVAKLDDGAADLDSGVGELYDGTNKLNGGVKSLYSGVDKLTDGAIDLTGGAIGLHRGAGQLDTGAKQFGEGLTALGQNGTALAQGFGAAADGILGLAASVQPLLNPDPNDPANQAVAAAIAALSSSADPNVQILLGAYQSEHGAMLQLAGGITQISQGFTDDLSDSADPVIGLKTAVQSYTDGVQQLGAKFPEVQGGISELAKGLDKFLDGMGKFNEGALELYDGAGKLRDGTSELKDGVSELKDGTAELKGGTADFVAETSDIDKKVDEEIDKLMGDFTGKAITPRSFLSEKNTDIASVQFVLKTPGIAELPKAVIPREVPPHMNPWEKLLDLFGMYKPKAE